MDDIFFNHKIVEFKYKIHVDYKISALAENFIKINEIVNCFLLILLFPMLYMQKSFKFHFNQRKLVYAGNFTD